MQAVIQNFVWRHPHWIAACICRGCFFMPIKEYQDFVFSLSDYEFDLLKQAVDSRIDKELFGFISYEEAALYYKRKPTCPKCGSTKYHKDGISNAKHIRYRCEDCDCSYTLLTNSIFNSAKLPFHKLMSYIQLMSFNVPLELMSQILDIAPNTAELWRKKIFETVNGYQDYLILSDNVFIDETYIEDYEVLAIKDDKHLRGLSKSKICIVVAIDTYKNMVAIISGHGKPSSKRIIKALKTHIKQGSNIIHDGDHSHQQLIDELNCTDEIYKANNKDDYYLENMKLINNMCAWLKRYIWSFIGMDINNLQSYLNWFVYLQRVKRYDEKWPKTPRILRHLLLTNTRFTRKY